MKAPEFYAEWIPILRDFAVRKDDDEVITAMKNGCIPCSQTPLTRLSYRLEEAIKMRYKDIMEDFERNQAEAHNEAGIETALTRLKDDLEKLKDAVYIPALPESIRLKFSGGSGSGGRCGAACAGGKCEKRSFGYNGPSAAESSD